MESCLTTLVVSQYDRGAGARLIASEKHGKVFMRTNVLNENESIKDVCSEKETRLPLAGERIRRVGRKTTDRIANVYSRAILRAEAG